MARAGRLLCLLRSAGLGVRRVDLLHAGDRLFTIRSRPSQFYGFYGLFAIGFLWGALGGAGTALPAVLDRKSLSEIFQPLSLLLALWCLLYFVEQPLSRIVQAQFGLRDGEAAARRHESVLYWLDSDWLSVFVILIGILAFDLVDRRFTHSLWLPAMAVVGGILGQLAQMGIARGGFSDWLHDVLVHVQGPRSGVDSDPLGDELARAFRKGKRLHRCRAWHHAGDRAVLLLFRKVSPRARRCFCTWRSAGSPDFCCFPFCSTFA